MNVILTGASKGIGRGIAIALAKAGCNLGLLARSQDELEAVAEACRACGDIQVFTRPCNLRSADDTQAAIDALTSALGGLDAIINNAGLIIRQDVKTISLDDWHAMVETNINGVFYTTRAAIPHFQTNGHGHIINISSISGRMPLPGGSGYAATKYAVSGFSESIFLELRDDNIKVTVIFPGSVDSQSHRHDPAAPTDWKVQPEAVGDACWSILNTSPGNCISRLEIRPLHRPPK